MDKSDIKEFYGNLSPTTLSPLSQEEIKFLPQAQSANSDAKTRKECKSFDDILEIIGSEGKYQKQFLYGVLCVLTAIAPILCLNTIFILAIPDHWCHSEGAPLEGPELEIWKNQSLPLETGPDGNLRYSQCYIYDEQKNPIKCPNGWNYDQTDSVTIPSEFNWVCDKTTYATDAFTWGSVGSVFGTMIFGALADKIGRKPVYFMSCVINLVFGTSSLFAPRNVMVYLILTGIAGTSHSTLFSMPTLIIAEACGAQYRSWTYAVTWMIWVVGNSLLPLIAWACKSSWFLFGMMSCCTAIIPLLFQPFINESPRWLISEGKGREALGILMGIAKTNGVVVDEDEIGEMVNGIIQRQREERGSQTVGVWTLFQKFRLAKNTVCLIIAMSMNNLLYYGITLNTTSMAGNKFVNYFLLSIIELPSGYLAGVLVEKTGRRWTQVGFFLFSVLSCALCAVAVVTPDWSYVEIAGALGIKFGITIASMVVYIQTTELFPTQLRSTGSALTSMMSSVVGITGPYIVFTGKFNAALPYAILGILATAGLVSAANLPETMDQQLPETLEDANSFGKGVKFWSYLPTVEKGEKASLAAVHEDSVGMNKEIK